MRKLTDKERREALEDETNYFYTSRFPNKIKIRFYFTDGKNGTIEIISKTEALAMMKEAEKKEFEHDQVD